jgi:predicted RNase H-like nuclease (RuvC/YqgF family)
MTHDIREITTDQAKWHKQGQKQADMDAGIKSRSRVEELLGERRDLQERIAWKESMVENKTIALRKYATWEHKHKCYTTEIFRWNDEIRELRTKLSELDTETDWHERSIKATMGGEGNGNGDFVANIKRCAAEMQEGRRVEEEGRAMLRRAEAEMFEVCKQ